MEAPPPLISTELRRWTRRLLSRYHIKPTKKLGQNFLVNARPIRDFAKLLEKSNVILEVGSGLGTLTYHLSKYSTKYYAVELDPKLVLVSYKVASNPKTHIIHADGILFADTLPVDTLVSNTAFNIVGSLLESAARNNSIQNVYIVAQQEVADRINAEPGSKDYGRLTVTAKLFFRVEAGPRYPPRYFYPTPKVNAMMVIMHRKKYWNVQHWGLPKLTACLFSQRNKLAYKVIRSCVDVDVPETLKTKRVRELTPEDIEGLLMWTMKNDRIHC